MQVEPKTIEDIVISIAVQIPVVLLFGYFILKIIDKFQGWMVQREQLWDEFLKARQAEWTKSREEQQELWRVSLTEASGELTTELKSVSSNLEKLGILVTAQGQLLSIHHEHVTTAISDMKAVVRQERQENSGRRSIP
jgi:hypothetical protein